jgi:hypothetical protein
MDISTLNALERSQAAMVLGRCCGSGVWVDRMVSARPFADGTALLLAAGEVWWDLSADDWQEAFAAASTTKDPLHADYQTRFGYPYVAFLGNRSAEDLSALYRDRMENDPLTELSVASAEQARVTNRALREALDLG